MKARETGLPLCPYCNAPNEPEVPMCPNCMHVLPEDWAEKARHLEVEPETV